MTLSLPFVCAASALLTHSLWAGANETTPKVPVPVNPLHTTLRQYCIGCHNKANSSGGINLEKIAAERTVGDSYMTWEKVADVIEHKRMPPPKLPAPSDDARTKAASLIRTRLQEYAEKNAGDPGRVTVRRLTSGEYSYAIEDLTGLDLKFDRDFVADSVGGEGFTNFGDVQFMQDANLERYLEAAKRVAAHAVIGSGPLGFFHDPGKSGLELSAVARIQEIYNRYGFRAASGEGGKPYGLDRYGKVFFAAWQYENRAALGKPTATLESFAAAEGLTDRFAQHIWKVLHEPNLGFPTAEVVSKWKALPKPTAATRDAASKAARAGTTEIQQFIINWPRWLFAAGELAAGGQGDERALVLTDASIQVSPKTSIRFFTRRQRGQKNASVHITLGAANPGAKQIPTIIWRNAKVRTRKADRGVTEPKPLSAVLDDATRQKLQFGLAVPGQSVGPNDFVTTGNTVLQFQLPADENAFAMELSADAELVASESADAIVRCTVSETEDVSKGRPTWALLGDPQSPAYKQWKTGVLAYAERLPQMSHFEPTPSDKDEIPAPFNNTYNQPERDFFHVRLKYHRIDDFIVDKMLDDATRVKLNQAWTDLLSSFEYHNVFLRFVADKYKVNLNGKGIADLTAPDFDAFPAEQRPIVKRLREQYDEFTKARSASHPRHVEDAIEFASRAWRRPLTPADKDRLRAFYTHSREVAKLDHDKAVRTLLTRVLVSPAFLYKFEPVAQSGITPLSNWELASRLSFFLWASVPDEELRRAAAAGELAQPSQLERQVKRMLADAKARRFSEEFFGQWLGFYRFDQYRGVDTGRFPEFTDEVKSAMYNEAVTFFEHLLRQDRPVREMFNANYTFLNKALAKHYGIKKEVSATNTMERVDGVNAFQRGGMLRLGAVLTATSAPLRTSPVKRGDWVLRRVLGTPTPPPPANAGSIPADEKQFGGLSLREKLLSHQRNATCASCHMRIDPLGFPLESFDPVGRHRASYGDGKPIDDRAAMADKTEIAGVDGLLDYLNKQEKQVLRNFSFKLLGYALGRTVQGSDIPLVNQMTQQGSEARLSQLITEVVRSKQFRYRRKDDVPAPATPKSVAINTARKEGVR